MWSFPVFVPSVHWDVGPRRPEIHGLTLVSAEKVDARLRSQAEHRDNAAEGELQWKPTDKMIDWLIDWLWGCDITKGTNDFWYVFLSKLMFFFLLLHFLFFHFRQFAYFDIIYSLYNHVLKFPILRTWLKAMRLVSASCFLDGKLWHRRGVEELHPDCGESKTEYTFGTVPANKGWFLAEWDQAKSQNKVNIRKQSQNLLCVCDKVLLQKKIF